MELVALDLHSTDHALDPADHRRGFYIVGYPVDFTTIIKIPAELCIISLYTTNFTEPLSYQGSAFLKLPKFP